MRLKYFKRKLVCLFLIFVLLLQSCAVYQKTPVSLSDAKATSHKVLIITTNDEKLKFKKIEQIDGIYYGIKKDDGKITKVPLNESEIKSIRVLDQSTSTILTIGTVVIPLVAVLIIFALDWGPDGPDI